MKEESKDQVETDSTDPSARSAKKLEQQEEAEAGPEESTKEIESVGKPESEPPESEPEVKPGDSPENRSPNAGSVESRSATEEEPVQSGTDVESTSDPAAADEKSNAETKSEPESKSYYRKLAEKVEQLVEMTDWAYVSMELANVEVLWEDGPDPEGVEISDFRKRIDTAREAFEKKKEAHYLEQKKIREENFEKKTILLNELKQIIEKEQWTATREVGRIRGRWDQIKPLPSGKAEELQRTYDTWIAEFESHKVDRIVRKKEKEEENLIGKLLILDKMGLLLKTIEQEMEESDWQAREKELDRLNHQWHKIGRVPAEKNQEIWDRYHKAQDQFHEVRFREDKAYRNQIEGYLKKKRELIREAEALIDSEDLPEASRRVNKLHRLWKKIGNLPQKEENELWERFKSTTDKFNTIKSENLDKLREQEQNNLEERQALIRRAEELQESEEWEETHALYQKLMEQWKSTGPVPKRVSGKVWKKFKKAMDHFYDRRRDHFREIRKKRKNNLDEKREVLDKLKELTNHESPIEAVELAKPLQEEFKKAGYVPIKFKNQIWKEYREICDEIYGRFRVARTSADLVGDEDVSDYSRKEIITLQKRQKEAGRLRKELTRLHSELIQMKESLSYFKPTSSGSTLLDSVHEKVSGLEQEIQKKEQRLDEIEREIDQLGEEEE